MLQGEKVFRNISKVPEMVDLAGYCLLCRASSGYCEGLHWGSRSGCGGDFGRFF